MNHFQAAKAHFLQCHQHPINQLFHHITNLFAIAAIFCIFYDWRLTVLCVVLTQVFALSGHIFFEKNEPAFNKYPGIVILVSLLWSLENGFGLRQIFSKSPSFTENR
ncbi:DUF962 domain-containing protein [Lusitaniella coriacea LEGE 07157]|uniref:DUF962 domain-containing protein n=1 Tax=Lusitaniella coriacea LEGE 07157 TaxID=945747 RepID=A0A8J7DYL4_9CYAN|nr:DUF962 domain-containing protein [Lusitaniella coriacea LEGE 07157]